MRAKEFQRQACSGGGKVSGNEKHGKLFLYISKIQGKNKHIYTENGMKKKEKHFLSLIQELFFFPFSQKKK
jgi:hypothetical protein